MWSGSLKWINAGLRLNNTTYTSSHRILLCVRRSGLRYKCSARSILTINPNENLLKKTESFRFRREERGLGRLSLHVTSASTRWMCVCLLWVVTVCGGLPLVLQQEGAGLVVQVRLWHACCCCCWWSICREEPQLLTRETCSNHTSIKNNKAGFTLYNTS